MTSLGFNEVGAYKSTIEKEDNVRLKFFLKHQELYITEGLLGKAASDKLQKQLKEIESSRKQVKKRQEAVKQARKEQEEKKHAVENSTALASKCLFSIRPVSPKTNRLLYDGKSYDGLGRKRYLDARYRLDPEEKLLCPETMNQSYGWRLGDVITLNDYKMPDHALTGVLRNAYFHTGGLPIKQTIHRNMVWYKKTA